MFMRYLGGGIGHLEQFLPASNDDENTAAPEDSDEDIEEIDNDNMIGGPEYEAGDDNDGNDNNGDNCVEGGEDEDESTEEDEEVEDDDLDPGESEDEETGNVY